MHGKFHLSYRKERAGVRIILLEHCEEVIMTQSDPVMHSPNDMIQPSLKQWFLQLLEDEADHLRLPSGFVKCTDLGIRKLDWESSPFIFMNLLIKVATCLGVSPIGNSCFIEPGSSSRIFLLWPTGKAARLEILPTATPDCNTRLRLDQVPVHISVKR